MSSVSCSGRFVEPTKWTVGTQVHRPLARSTGRTRGLLVSGVEGAFWGPSLWSVGSNIVSRQWKLELNPGTG